MGPTEDSLLPVIRSSRLIVSSTYRVELSHIRLHAQSRMLIMMRSIQVSRLSISLVPLVFHENGVSFIDPRKNYTCGRKTRPRALVLNREAQKRRGPPVHRHIYRFGTYPCYRPQTHGKRGRV